MIYFVLYLFLEVMVSTSIASEIGGLMTFFELIGSAFIGIAILINFRSTLAENMRAVSYNCINLQQFQELNLFTLFGAILLILPGFLTDIVGIVLQFSVFTSMLVTRYSSNMGNCEPHPNQKKDDDNVIDVEILSDTSITK
ncbi:MAG TPA: FxsA family protein [Helicobacteraceae bacterium]|nr:FxsA family protein [Helicobacteraceae bacterium]